MFKKISLLILIVGLALMLGACTSKGYVKDIYDVKPTVVVEEVKAEVVATPAARTVEIPVVVVVKGKVLFDFNSFELDTVAKLTLEKIAVQMESAPDTLLILKGHTDKVGSDEYNQILSEDRADAVENYLCEAGVPVDRIMSVKGFGKTLLLPELSDRENRRVIILTVK